MSCRGYVTVVLTLTSTLISTHTHTHTHSYSHKTSTHAKIKTTKISSKGLTSNSVEVCTSENFPLYAVYHRKAIMRSECTAGGEVELEGGGVREQETDGGDR